jgi:hypothetical protein
LYLLKYLFFTREFRTELIILTNRRANPMCFSPEASFVGGIIISTVGVVTLRKVHKPSQLVFASIPLFFGIQQITRNLACFKKSVPTCF